MRGEIVVLLYSPKLYWVILMFRCGYSNVCVISMLRMNPRSVWFVELVINTVGISLSNHSFRSTDWKTLEVTPQHLSCAGRLSDVLRNSATVQLAASSPQPLEPGQIAKTTQVASF